MGVPNYKVYLGSLKVYHEAPVLYVVSINVAPVNND